MSKTDYSKYRLSVKERVTYGIIGTVAGFSILYLFYSSWIICLPGSIPVTVGFLYYIRHHKAQKRKRMLMIEFRDAMDAMVSALSAGYSMENAVTEALKDLRLLYGCGEGSQGQNGCDGRGHVILHELEDIQARIRLGVPLDELFYELGVRSGVDDIIVFSQVYTTARKSGGNLVKIMKRTSEAIAEKIDIEREVQTMIAGKRLESLCMTAIPLLIIVYLRVFSPEFLAPLYRGLMGRGFMTFALVVYCLTTLWSRRIMNIRY